MASLFVPRSDPFLATARGGERQRTEEIGRIARGIPTRMALTYTAVIVVALAAHHAGRPDLFRSPKRVLAHLWEGDR